ncbi:MAG: FliM/FliN family flagellar motor C-terminal domain-containing protein [Parvularculaceae bacterium]|nr:FliM/FliN family flagellar motor C-terminal domain-containing protein [Parvularculaceae bacterium]
MSALEQAEVELTVVVGAATLPLSRIMSLSRGDVIGLGRDASGPISVLANGSLFAKAAVTLIGDRVGVELPGGP